MKKKFSTYSGKSLLLLMIALISMAAFHFRGQKPIVVLTKFMSEKENLFSTQSDSNYVASLLHIPSYISILRSIKSDMQEEHFNEMSEHLSNRYDFELRLSKSNHKDAIAVLDERRHHIRESIIKESLTLKNGKQLLHPSLFHAERSYGALPYDTYLFSIEVLELANDVVISFNSGDLKTRFEWKFKKNDLDASQKISW